METRPKCIEVEYWKLGTAPVKQIFEKKLRGSVHTKNVEILYDCYNFGAPNIKIVS